MFVKELKAFRGDVKLTLRLLDLLVLKCEVRAKGLGAKPRGGIPDLQLTCSGFNLDCDGLEAVLLLLNPTSAIVPRPCWCGVDGFRELLHLDVPDLLLIPVNVG